MPNNRAVLASTNPNRGVYDDSDLWRRERSLPPPPNHAIIPIWYSHVLPAIIAIIDHLEVQMTVIYLLRLFRPTGDPYIDRDRAEEAPTVIWIGVEPGTLSKDAAAICADRCDAALRSLMISDCYVEIHTCNVTESASPLFLSEDPTSKFRHLEIPFQRAIGWNIAPVSLGNTGGTRGTGGVFLKLQGSDATYLLTCQHVLDQDPTRERRFDSSGSGEDVTLFGRIAFQNEVKKVEDEVLEAEREVNRATTRLGGAREGQNVDALEKFLAERVQDHQQLSGLHGMLVGPWHDAANRVIGRVQCYPRIGSNVPSAAVANILPAVHVEKGIIGFSEDWGLVRVADEIFLGNESPNILRVDKIHSRSSSLLTAASWAPFCFEPDIMGSDYNVRVTQVAPLSETLSASSRVYKYGAATKETTGTVSRVMAVRRKMLSKNVNGKTIRKKFDTLVLAIHEIDRKRFSDVGDSGSLIVDEKGRAVGMITSGKPPVKEKKAGKDDKDDKDGKDDKDDENVDDDTDDTGDEYDKSNKDDIPHDVTHATPMSFIFDRINIYCGREPRLA